MSASHRDLPPVPSVHQVVGAMHVTITTASSIGDLYEQAQDIVYLTTGGGNTKVSGGSNDPTLDAVMGGYVNGVDDEHDVVAAERKALRSAVDAMASAVYQLGLADGRLRSIIRAHERSGHAANPDVGSQPSQTWTGREAERIAAQSDRARLAEGLTDKRHWPRRTT